jgi:hypothetical protein
MGGVLERYPTLRLVPTELVPIDWVAPLIQRLDSGFTGMGDFAAGRDVAPPIS